MERPSVRRLCASLARPALALGVLAFTAEVAATALLRLQIVAGHVPTYRPFEPRAYTFWADIDENFGVWHYPRATFRHKKACFDVTYRTNSAGARDPERKLESVAPRVIVLGDSFMEGFGVRDGARLSDLLEQATGIEHLNFATSGFFGPTQYLLMYRSLAKQYRHDAVLVGILPANDFDEDDLAFGKRVFQDRYRPYLVGTYPDYRIEYFLDELTASAYRAPPPTWRRRVSDFLYETTHSYNVYRYYRDGLAFRSQPGEERAVTESRYYRFEEGDLLRLRYVLSEISEEAGTRPVTVIALPTHRDVEAYAAAGGVPPLSRRLIEMSGDVGFRFVDLLPSFAAAGPEASSFFMSCDGHWSERGNAVAARVLLDLQLPLRGGAPAAAPPVEAAGASR